MINRQKAVIQCVSVPVRMIPLYRSLLTSTSHLPTLSRTSSAHHAGLTICFKYARPSIDFLLGLHNAELHNALLVAYAHLALPLVEGAVP